MDDTHVPRSDQWSTVSAHRALALLLFLAVVAAAAVGLCAFAALRKKMLLHKQQVVVDVEAAGTSVSPIKKMVMSTCDGSNKSAEDIELRGEELEKLQLAAADKGSIAAASVSPVWQRRILMGERCELPHFSGLILYNEQGLPIIHHNQ